MAGLLDGYSSDLEGIQFPGENPRTGAAHLRWMCRTARDNAAFWPVDKTGRWLGFVQGVLAARGLLDVDTERDRTRPMFHAAYGRAVPTETPESR